MTRYLLDTNIVSLVLRGDPGVVERFRSSLTPDNTFLACPVVWFEVRRGLQAIEATAQWHRFEEFYAEFEWQDYVKADWELAADLWATRRRSGLPVGDADLLIAVFARNRNAVLVTRNEKDFTQLGATIENWVHPPADTDN